MHSTTLLIPVVCLPSCKYKVVQQLLSNLSECMWRAPQAYAHHKSQHKPLDPNTTPSSTPSPDHDPKKSTSSVSESGDDEDDVIALQDTVFDSEKAVCCSVEGGSTLVHGSGGRGYGLGATGITAGCYQWKVSPGRDVLGKSNDLKKKLMKKFTA